MSVWANGVSVLLPTHNDQPFLEDCLRALQKAEVLEVLVYDQGSTDHTIAVARDMGATILRGADVFHAMVTNAAQRARGSALWLLYPRCIVPHEAAYYILEGVSDASTAGGFFRVKGLGVRGWLSNWFGPDNWVTPMSGVFCAIQTFGNLDQFSQCPPTAQGLLLLLAQQGGIVQVRKPIRVVSS